MYKSNNRKIIRFTCTILLISVILFSQMLNVRSDNITNNYTSLDNLTAHKGKSPHVGSFNNDFSEFTATEYSNISFNDDNYVYSVSEYEYPYHHFDFLINENIDDITNVEIRWIGIGSEGSSVSYGQELYVKENDNWVSKDSSDGDLDNINIPKFELTFSYTDNFDEIINNGHLHVSIYSTVIGCELPDLKGDLIEDNDADASEDSTPTSSLKSYYIEVNVTYFSSNEENIDIQVPENIKEKEDFIVSITSNINPVENAEVTFLDEKYFTNSEGYVIITAPSVESDTDFLLSVSKPGYVSKQKTVTIINEFTNTLKDLSISITNEVIEGDSFEVYVYDDSSGVYGAVVNFSGVSYYTDSSGFVDLVAPSVDENSSFLVTAYKSGYDLCSEYVFVVDSNSNIVDPLLIDFPSQVVEGDSFEVYVSVSGNGVENSIVSFLDSNYYTDENGLVILSAPSVDENSSFLITANKKGFSKISSNINVINKKEIKQNGYIFGNISDSKGNLIEDSIVCAKVEQNDYIFKCAFSDSSGFYNLSISEGIYSITVEKEGYKKQTVNDVTVSSNLGTNIDFVLVNESKSESNSSLFDYTISNEVKKGSVIGSVDVSSKSKVVKMYSDVQLNLLSSDIFSNEGVNFLISGQSKPGTKLVVHLGEISHPENILVIYDSKKIEKTRNFKSFFSTNNTKEEWVLTSSAEDNTFNVLILNIPSYSQHEVLIKLEEIIKPDFTYLGFMYLVFSFFIASVFVSFGVFRKRFFK